MQILLLIVYFIAMMLVLFAALALLKKFVFSKVRINKYIPLVLSIGLLVFQFVWKTTNMYASIGLTIAIILLFMWYWDINQTGGLKAANKKIVIRPKAKPNRVKNKK
ncbi:MAG: hypothetical protein PUE01_03340 [Clostridiaceae bacterium]|nr:hypothetical protein [Clostridiaceae bacterium]